MWRSPSAWCNERSGLLGRSLLRRSLLRGSLLGRSLLGRSLLGSRSGRLGSRLLRSRAAGHLGNASLGVVEEFLGALAGVVTVTLRLLLDVGDVLLRVLA